MNTALIVKSVCICVFACAMVSHVQLHADDTPPVFRPRTDANSAKDLQLLRDELNKANDAKGAVNPLGNFNQRNAQPAGSTLTNSGPDVSDKESQQKPNLDPNAPLRTLAPASSNSKATKGIEMLPGPRYTIIQQAYPPVHNSVVDGFRPARFVSDLESNVRPSLQDPVSFASADIPIVRPPGGYIANFQEIPYGATVKPPAAVSQGTNILPNATGAPPPFVPPNNTVIPFNPQPFPTGNLQPGANVAPVIPYNPQPILPDATNPPVLPYAGSAPQNNFGVPPPIYSTPIPNNAPLGTSINPPLNNPVPYYNPSTFNNQPQVYNPNVPMGVNPGLSGGVPMRSPNESIMPNYSRSSSIVNGAPFVSGPPCQFDASYMVSRNAYRQSGDPCAQPTRGAANAYAPIPYATQPSGSPFSYVPPTAMPTSNYGYDSGYRSLVGFGQTLNNAHLGRGIVGQPVAYVDRQPIRNFFRYIFP